ncbi:MAG: hypothetical protein JWM57_2854 [Phycisphaerales bacterium]|nr:hypothetical protein [Phycisphaerales bacterium]
MNHVEGIEPRQMFAALTPDSSLAGTGSVPLPRGFGSDLLATHGAIYVEGYNPRRRGFYVYKYSDNGQLDTSWGYGGSIKPIITQNVRDDSVVPKMIYDIRTGGLLLAIDGGRSITIQRFQAGGATDAAWGTNGVVTYTARNSKLMIGEILPMARKQMAMAFTSVEQAGVTFNGEKTDGGEADLILAQFNRSGRIDPNFDFGKPLKVIRGHIKTQEFGDDDRGSKVVNINAPVFGDLEQSAKGLRLVSLREKTDATYDLFDNRQGSTKTGRTDWIVDTIEISADGTAAQQYSTRIYRDYDEPEFDPKLAVLDGKGVAVMSSVTNPSRLNDTLQVTRLLDGDILSTTPIGGGTEAEFNFKPYRNVYGSTYGLAYSGAFNLYYVRLNNDLSLRRQFIAEDTRTFPVNGYSANAVDDEGRLVVLNGSGTGPRTLIRLTPS